MAEADFERMKRRDDDDKDHSKRRRREKELSRIKERTSEKFPSQISLLSFRTNLGHLYEGSPKQNGIFLEEKVPFIEHGKAN